MGGNHHISIPLKELLVGLPLVFLQVDTLKTRCNFGLALRNAGRRFDGWKPPLMGWFKGWFGGWDFYRISPRYKVVTLIFSSKESQGVKVLLFFFRETCKKNVPFFFYKQAGGSSSNLIGWWWWKNLGGFTFRHFPQAASWNPLSLLTKNHQRNEGLVKRKRS